MALSLLQSIIQEQHHTKLVDLTLGEIIAAGKVTNPYQLFVLGHVSQFFKNGLKSVDLYLDSIALDVGTSSVLKDALLKMSDLEHVKLATYLLDCIKAGESLLHDTGSSMMDWINFVQCKQR